MLHPPKKMNELPFGKVDDNEFELVKSMAERIHTVIKFQGV